MSVAVWAAEDTPLVAASGLRYDIALAERPVIGIRSKDLAELLAALNVGFRLNLRANRPEVSVRGGSWRAFTDRDKGLLLDAAYRLFAQRFQRGEKSALKPWRPGERDLAIAIDALSKMREVDGWRMDDVDRWPAWDGTPRVDTFLSTLWPQLAGDPLAEWASRALFLMPVERCLSPGAVLREIPVLIGAQRTGKSSLVFWLAGHNREWHTDALTLDADRKTQEEVVAGKVFVEISEMSGSRRSAVAAMKVFLAATTDGTQRAAYARNPSPTARLWVPVGTANDLGSGVLPDDPSGNTRFVALPVGTPARFAFEYPMDLRAQCFAEALHNHTAGVWPTARLPESLYHAQAQANQEAATNDPVLEEAVNQLKPEPLSATDIEDTVFAAWPDTITKPSSFRLRAELTRQGWTRGGYREFTTATGRTVRRRAWNPPAGAPTQRTLD